MMMDNQKLRKARQQKRWSIEKAAEKVGVSWLTFSRWEHGTQRPRPATLDMLCTAFGMSPEELGYAAENCLPRTDVEIDPESREDVKRREALQKIVQATGTTLMLSDILQRLTGVLIPSMKLEEASLPGQGCFKRGEKEAKDELDGSKLNEGIFRRFARACSYSGGSGDVKERSGQALWRVRSIDQAIPQTAA